MFHSGAHREVHVLDGRSGFLGMLRPYGGLRQWAFDEVMACARILAPSLSVSLSTGRWLTFWSICHLARAWGVNPEGMLRRNGLASDQEIKVLVVDRADFLHDVLHP